MYYVGDGSRVTSGGSSREVGVPKVLHGAATGGGSSPPEYSFVCLFRFGSEFGAEIVFVNTLLVVEFWCVCGAEGCTQGRSRSR